MRFRDSLALVVVLKLTSVYYGVCAQQNESAASDRNTF
jgi:hypothetical protein